MKHTYLCAICNREHKNNITALDCCYYFKVKRKTK